MAVVLVQSTQKVVSGVNGTTLAYGSNVASGNLLCVAQAQWVDSATTITTPTDTLAHTYVGMAAEQGDANVRLRSFYKEGCSGGANTVTFDISGAATGDLTVVVSEFSGIVTSSALDQIQSGTATGTAASSGATPTTTQADELLWGGLAFGDSGLTITETGGASLVQECESGAPSMPIGTSYQLVSAAGAYTTTWTIGGSATWFAHIATFKALAEAAAAVAFRSLSRPFPFRPGSPPKK